MNPYLNLLANSKHVKCFMDFSGMFLLMISGFRLKLTVSSPTLPGGLISSLGSSLWIRGARPWGHGIWKQNRRMAYFVVFSQACIEVLCDFFLCEFEIGFNILYIYIYYNDRCVFLSHPSFGVCWILH